MIRNMEKSESEPISAEGSDGVITNYWPWLHLSSQLIHYVLFQFVSFPSFVLAIHDRV
jgi:mediator of RNA polymerase II transcription subunit 23